MRNGIIILQGILNSNANQKVFFFAAGKVKNVTSDRLDKGTTQIFSFVAPRSRICPLNGERENLHQESQENSEGK